VLNDESEVWNELLHESDSDDVDDGFDPSQLAGRGKRGKGRRARQDQGESTNDNEAILAMLQQIQETLLDKGKSSQDQRRHQGRQSRTSHQVQMVKKLENDDIRLRVLVSLV
jgi:hypothetical protein